MGITVNTSPQQITASVGETKIDVSVGGGLGPTGSAGPQGPAGPSYTLPVATASVLGGVKIGSGISIDVDGVISASAGYTLPIATAGTLGGVRIGSGISIDPATGVISASSGYTLPTATANVLGGVKIGSGVTITDGVISVSTNYAAASDFDQGVKTTDSVQFSNLTLENDLTFANFAGFNGQILTANSFGIVSPIGIGTAGQSLVVNSGATAPEWKTLSAADVGASSLGHAHGVTADITAGNWKVLYSNGSGAIVELALGASGTVLTSGGTAAAPTFQAVQGESFHPFLLAGM